MSFASDVQDRVAPTVADLQAALAAGQNQDGGWPYYARHSSRIEPTAWAVLASRIAGNDAVARRGVRYLERCQQESGLLAEQRDCPPNLAFNALAALAFGVADRDSAAHRTRVAAALCKSTGRRVEENRSEVARQDNHLVGWSWIPDTFSWLEPTALCVLALKRLRQHALEDARIDARVEQGERLLVDRSCRAGGWNYGSPNVYGKDLYAYVPTTALALLALQDRRDLAEVARGLEWLRHHAAAERSGLALALSVLCLQVFAWPSSDVSAALCAQWSQTQFLGNLATTAMAVCALAAPEDGPHAFRL